MANKTMNVVLNMVKCVPKGEGKRADEQYGDQCFDKWMFEIYLQFFLQNALPASASICPLENALAIV